MITPARLAFRHPLRLAVCGITLLAICGAVRAEQNEPAHSAELDVALIRQAKRNGVPEKLVRRIIMRESKYDARARNHLYWGLMQISYPTAKSMGFKGTPQELLNPFVNLTYAVPYLANAFVIAGKQEDAAVRLYASGYYATAKARGLLSVLRTADSTPVVAEPNTPIMALADTTQQPQTYGVFGALFGAGQQPNAEPAAQVASNAAEVAASTPLPPSKDDADSVSMSADKSGALKPPKQWLRDGGISTVARGEQRIEQVAAYEQANSTDLAPAKAAKAHAKSHKTTTFAALDLPPSNAQAYAGATDPQDPRMAQSQAAIAQATSGQPGPADPQAAPQPQGATASAEPAPDDKPLKKHASHKSHADKATKLASAKKAKVASDHPDDGRAPVAQAVQ